MKVSCHINRLADLLPVHNSGWVDPKAVLDMVAKRTFPVSVNTLAPIVQPTAVITYSHSVKSSRSIGQISIEFISEVLETVSVSHRESHPQVALLPQSMLADVPELQTSYLHG